MGMYTEIVLAVELKNPVPDKTIEVLKYMVGDIPWEHEPKDLPGHEFFSCKRWSATAACGSSYFAGITHSEFRYDGISKSWFLTVRSNLKNYDNEIEKFCAWLAPYCRERSKDDDGIYFIGFSRYEEDTHPTLIYFQRGQVIRKAVS